MSLEITCKYLYANPEQKGTGKNGEWVKQEVIVETEEQYPKKVCLNAWGDMVERFRAIPQGSRVKVNFRIESREYNGRWYTDVRPWKIEMVEQAAGMGAGAPAAAPMAAPVASVVAPDDDLPF